MDDNDGLLLNFSSDAPISTMSRNTSKVSGGKWKDRRKLQLKLQGRGRTQQKNKEVSGVNTINVDESRMKNIREQARKIQAGKGERPNEFSEERYKRPKLAETKGEYGGKNQSYVSSLFTSNQKATMESTKEYKETNFEPSNAPLSDSSTFAGLGINERLAKHLEETMRFKAPTKVQRSVIPTLSAAERDIFVKAQTGSGKTLAFLLPILNSLMSSNIPITRESGLFAIILTPTRELASQIYSIMEAIVRCCHYIVPGIVIGGEKKKSEKARLRKGVNILVATPGRLADHFENTKSMDLSDLRWLVFDEGDRLIDMGFEETITQISRKIEESSRVTETSSKWINLPFKKVNLLCSATMHSNVKNLGEIVLNNPEMINVDSKGGDKLTSPIDGVDINEDNMSAPDQLTQNILIVPPKLRLVSLAAMIKNVSSHIGDECRRTVVFFSCSDSVNFHFNAFSRNGKRIKQQRDSETGKVSFVEVESEEDKEETENVDDDCVLSCPTVAANTICYKLHGSLSQQIRTSTLQSFVKMSGRKHLVLFCTDVASRGLDLPKISDVVEYDPPFSIEDHLHRIGRSARAGNKGKAALFLLPGDEEKYIDGKIRHVHPREESVRIANFEDVLKEGFGRTQIETEAKSSKKEIVKRKEGDWDFHATTWHLDIERWILEDKAALSIASQAFSSHVRAYATHLSSEKDYFNVKHLHLGHLAKSFGLRETPKRLGKSAGSTNTNEKESKGEMSTKKEDPRKKMLRMAKMAVNSSHSEFNY